MVLKAVDLVTTVANLGGIQKAVPLAKVVAALSPIANSLNSLCGYM